MQILELFSGTHSVGVIAEKEHKITSLDRDLGAESKLYDYKSKNHIQEDIMTWDFKKIPQNKFDLITASPVCLWWSAMRRCVMSKEKIEKDIDLYGKPMVDKVIEIIEYFKPVWWWIENPHNGLMKHYIFEKYPNFKKHYVVDYCAYQNDIGYKKRTIFFTNIPNFNPKTCDKKTCKNMENGRHKINIAYNTYILEDDKKIFIFTKDLREKYKKYKKYHQKTTKNKYDRYKIPFNLIKDLIDCCNQI